MKKIVKNLIMTNKDKHSSQQFEGNFYNYKPIKRRLPILNDQQYIETRLTNQINWHRVKSGDNLKKFKLIKYVDTIVAALIPIALILNTCVDFSCTY